MTKEEIEQYIDNFVLHTLENIEYGNYFSEEIVHIVKNVINRCEKLLLEYERAGTKKRAEELFSKIKEILKEMKNKIDDFIDEQLPLIIQEEEDWLEGIGSELGIEFDFSKKGLDMLGIIPIAAAGSALMYGSTVCDSLSDIYKSMITQGLITGSNYTDIMSSYTPRINSFERGLKLDSETLGEDLGGQYDRIVFTHNKDKIKRYVWSSMLDTSTCAVCGSLDGTVYDDITNVGIYPVHNCCRCRLMILPDGLEPEELKESYEHWFNRQNKSIQKRILGPTRYQMFKDGWKYKHFVNNGKVIKLKEIQPAVTLNEKTLKLVKSGYPEEQFAKRKITDNSNLYVSKERIKSGIKDPLVYNSDKLMASTLVKETDRDFYLLAENKVGVKNPDGFYISDTMKMKHVRGDLNKLGKNAIAALKQSENVFLYADKSFSKDACIRKLQGSIKAKRAESLRNGTIFVEPSKDALLYIFTNGQLFKMNWGDVL